MTGKVLVKSFSTTQTFGSVYLVCLFVIASTISVAWTLNPTKDKITKRKLWRDCLDDSDIMQFCEPGKSCIKVNILEVVKRYPNLFVHKYEKESVKRFFILENSENSDMDTCCPTSRTFDKLPARRNIFGKIRIIFQTKTLRQWIPVGSCMNGNCEKCQIMNRTMSILVIDFDWKHDLPLEFDQFSIPLYCTCAGKQSRFRNGSF